MYPSSVTICCFLYKYGRIVEPASGHGARVSACAGLINQLQSCRFDLRIACLENPDSNCRRLVDGGVGTPRPELLTGAKKSQLRCLISFQLPMGFGLSEFHSDINKIHFLKKEKKKIYRTRIV